jgi:hypothetical protein
VAPFLRDRRHVGIVRASAIDKSANFANDLRRKRDQEPSRVACKGPGTDLPQEFTVNNEYACSCILMRSTNTIVINLTG